MAGALKFFLLLTYLAPLLEQKYSIFKLNFLLNIFSPTHQASLSQFDESNIHYAWLEAKPISSLQVTFYFFTFPNLAPLKIKKFKKVMC
jgi:hypothetical protein